MAFRCVQSTLLCTLVGIAGCGSRTGWMPMRVGKTWTYQVRAGFDRRIETVKVVRALTVASADGFELAGPSGVSRLAWKHGTLYADSTANASFSPPVPLIVLGQDISKEPPKQVATWHGRIVTLGQERACGGVLTEHMDTVDLGTRKVSAMLSTLTLTTPSGYIELESWFQEGVGLIQQDQRTNGVRVVQLQLLDRTTE